MTSKKKATKQTAKVITAKAAMPSTTAKSTNPPPTIGEWNKYIFVKQPAEDDFALFDKLESETTIKQKVKRAYVLANDMVKRGLLSNTAEAIKKQIEETLKWNEDAFAAMKRVVEKASITHPNEDIVIYDISNEDKLIDDTLNDNDVSNVFDQLGIMPPEQAIKKKMTVSQKLKAELAEKQKVIDANKIHITNLKDQKEKLSKELNAQIAELKSDQSKTIQDVNGYVNLIKLAMMGLEKIGNKTEAKESSEFDTMQEELKQILDDKYYVRPGKYTFERS